MSRLPLRSVATALKILHKLCTRISTGNEIINTFVQLLNLDKEISFKQSVRNPFKGLPIVQQFREQTLSFEISQKKAFNAFKAHVSNFY